MEWSCVSGTATVCELANKQEDGIEKVCQIFLELPNRNSGNRDLKYKYLKRLYIWKCSCSALNM
jgi:hypothetical protein